MVNGSSGNIQSYFKRQKTDAVAEDPPPAQPLPLLLELEQQHENQDEEPQTNNSVPLPVVFRGMEFLERDPALRPQIWQYPPNQRDSVRRSYLLLGPMQPKLKEYKASGKKGHQRRFQYKWFEKFPSWLEYSEDSHRAYCLFCFVSSRNFSSKGGSDVFTVHGFDNWKRSYATKTERGFILCMMKEILGLTEALGQALQKRSQDIVNAIRLVFATKECLRKLRSDDGWEEFFCTVVEFCVNHGIEIPDMKETYIMRGGRARHQPDHFTKEQYFRVEIFRATLDSQLYELDRRFREKIMDLLSTSAKLIPRNKFKSFKASDICELVKKYYPADFSQQDQYVLEQQLNLFVADASNDVELKNVSTLTDLCQLLVETGRDKIYHLIDRLLRLLVTLPVSIASAERAFSSLKIIKTRLRNKMEDENLANNLVVHIEREIAEKYNFKDILMDFKSMGDRKADL